ncbi:MAG: hypothetical protein VX938_03415, partial [Myxococcota bacterium]|nr:hypothetical protein [Myxococcota bacterium]
MSAPEPDVPQIGGGVDLPPSPPPRPEPDVVEDTGPVAPTCGTAVGDLPEGLTEVFYDDGSFATSVTEQLQMEVIGQNLGLDPVNQAVRFDLEHPAKIHGIKMRFYDLPEDGNFPVKVSLRPDMGLNGFD